MISSSMAVRLRMWEFPSPIGCLTSSSALAIEVPALKGRVNDYAGLLSGSTISQLDTVLVNLETTDSTQIVVLTIPSLDGDSLEDFSLRSDVSTLARTSAAEP